MTECAAFGRETVVGHGVRQRSHDQSALSFVDYDMICVVDGHVPWSPMPNPGTCLIPPKNCFCGPSILPWRAAPASVVGQGKRPRPSVLGARQAGASVSRADRSSLCIFGGRCYFASPVGL